MIAGSRRAGAIVAVLVFALPAFYLHAAPAQASDAGAKEPYKLMRTLQSLQEQIARGNVTAHNAQRSVIDHITAQFMAADPQVWQERRNAHAAIAFALGGGPPQVLRHLVRLDPPPAVDRDLLTGALAYVEGREAEALEALGGFDPTAFPGHLGAQLAIVQSALFVRHDPDRAVRLLAIARLLAPGTLIEEAALRREVFVEGQRGNIERLEFLSIQYLRRFRHSVYAGNFRQRFVVLLAQLDFAENVENFMRLESILAQMDGEGKRDLYLFFARHSMLNGRIELARLASSRAEELSAGGSAEEARASFYDAASSLVTSDFEAAVERLLAIEPEKLPPADVPLLEAALDLAVQIGEAVFEDAQGESAEDEGEPESTRAEYEPTAVMLRAEAAIADIDLLLKGARR